MQAMLTQTRQVPPWRWLMLVAGLSTGGFGIAMMLNAEVGLGPWDVLHQGLHLQSGISFGQISILVGLAIMLAWIPLGERLGPGTLINIIWIGLTIDIVSPHIPTAPGLLLQILQATLGVVLMGIGTGVYLSARLGSGPRDGLMMGLVRKTGWSVRLIRTLIELSALLGGLLLGGSIGIGTLLFAFGIGPVVQMTLSFLSKRLPAL